MHDYNAVDISHSLSMDFSFVFETNTHAHNHTCTCQPKCTHKNVATIIFRFQWNQLLQFALHELQQSYYTHLFLILLKNSFFYHSIEIWNVFVCFALHSEWTVTSILHTSKKNVSLFVDSLVRFQVRFAFRLQFLSRWFMHVYSIRWRRNKNEIET